MFKKFLLIFFGFFFLVLFQTGFLIHFLSSIKTPNLVLVVLFSMIFFDLFSFELILWAIFCAGFFLDLFSVFPLGLSIVLFWGGALLIEKILKNIREPNIFLFAILFLAFFLFYNLGLSLFDYFSNSAPFFLTSKGFLIHLVYSFASALLIPGLVLCLNSKYLKFLRIRK